MADRAETEVYSIAAHRGFADALASGLVPRYFDAKFGLARLTLIVPSSRAARTISEAFTRHCGETGKAGMLLPRMVAVGDLDFDEALGALLDPLGDNAIPPAIEPTQRWLELAQLIAAERAEQGEAEMPGAASLRFAKDTARVIDRLLVEEKQPADLLGDPILDMLGDLSSHWQRSLRLFARVHTRWQARLEEMGRVDAATRRNLLFDRAARQWRETPPNVPVVAAGVTSASPALARLLRVIADLPKGAVILPDCDLSMDEAAWEELGRAGAAPEPDASIFGPDDALTHPQYHLKLLLNRMGIARGEVRQWHRKGAGAALPARSHAISSLFLPPKASRSWVDLGSEKRRLSGVRLMTSATSEEEAQAIAILVRDALDTPQKRVAVVSADRNLAHRVKQHLERWDVKADDSAGRALSQTPAGRLFGLLADIASHGPKPAELIGLLAHPLVHAQEGKERLTWLNNLRRFDRKLRGPSPAPGLGSLRMIAAKAGVEEWWEEVESVLTPITALPDELPLASAIDALAQAAEELSGEGVWSREDGRDLARMVEDLRLHARNVGTVIAPQDMAPAMRDVLDEVAVRPPYGGHPRVAIYGLLESRMARADLVICAGLNEGSWPQIPAADPLLAPGVLRALGVPAAEFRIGLAAHDLAGAMGAPEVVLSRSQRDVEGPSLPSRFLLRVEALLGDLAEDHRELDAPALVPLLGRDAAPAEDYPRPMPKPAASLRKVDISATALDRLLGDPYQFYAQKVLGLGKLDPLAADPFSDPALRGTLVHNVLERWHIARSNAGGGNPQLPLIPFAVEQFDKEQVHPLFKGLWQPRILAALERFEQWIAEAEAEGRTTIAIEARGEMIFDEIVVHGRADRIDQLADGTLAVVDYKTGTPPKAKQVEAGYALQMGVLGLIAREGAFKADGQSHSGDTSAYEYWSLAKKKGEFGYVDEPVRTGRNNKRTGLTEEEFLPAHEEYLKEAIGKYLKGDAPFIAKENPDYPGYSDYDQLMRLEEWIIRLTEGEGYREGGAE